MESKLDKIKKEIEMPLEKKNIKVSDIYFGEEDNVKTLFIVVDGEKVDLKLCEQATEIIDPIIDELNIIDEEYVLDVSGKVSK